MDSPIINCVYIPQMSKNVTEEMVSKEMVYHCVGIVKRVDFIAIGQKIGFEEYHHPLFKSAFVHFETVYPTTQMRNVLEQWMREGQYKIMANCSAEYWYLKKAHHPIQETLMNNHQIVENTRWLQSVVFRQAQQIESQSVKIDEQSETIQRLEKKVEGIHTVLYQLLGGLFNQRSQVDEIEKYLSILHDREPVYSDSYSNSRRFSNSRARQWPTTRQGDEHEERLKALEESVQNMLTFENCANVFDVEYSPIQLKADNYDESWSVGSPRTNEAEIVDIDGDEESDNSITSREDRIKNSAELCGNN